LLHITPQQQILVVGGSENLAGQRFSVTKTQIDLRFAASFE